MRKTGGTQIQIHMRDMSNWCETVIRKPERTETSGRHKDNTNSVF
jgi:hypothetical protein